MKNSNFGAFLKKNLLFIKFKCINDVNVNDIKKNTKLFMDYLKFILKCFKNKINFFFI